MSRSISNVAHSVHARLKNAARDAKRPFNDLLQRYGMERFLYRLSQTDHVDAFTLKGALLFQAYDMTMTRPTRDIDLLGTGDPIAERLRQVMADCCTVDVENDGITFDMDSIDSQPIRAEARYAGQRLSVMAYLRTARIPIQVDIGFGDVIVPHPTTVAYPTILDFPAPRLQAYTVESAVAEKYEAMIEFGAFNSRMKDFYDIWWLSENRAFEIDLLARAIAATFERRTTSIPDRKPVALTRDFITDRTKAQWRAFFKKLHVQPARSENEILSLVDVIDQIASFLWPATQTLITKTTASTSWPPGGPWKSATDDHGA